jgi:hypothetical protein
MARVKIPITVIDANGNAVAGASVHVKHRQGGATAIAYQNETGPTTVTNPLLTDAYGRLSSWVERGTYVADITGTGISPYSEPFDAAPAGDRSIDTLWLPASTIETTLPPTPFDGQEILYQPASFDAGVGVPPWHLRYRQASPHTHKWDVISAGPMRARVGTEQSVSSVGTWQDAGTVGPQVTVPLAGVYQAYARADGTVNSTLSTAVAIGLAVGATSPADQHASEAWFHTFSSLIFHSLFTEGEFTCTSGQDIRLRYFGNGTSGQFVRFKRRAIVVTPLRVG